MLYSFHGVLHGEADVDLCTSLNKDRTEHISSADRSKKVSEREKFLDLHIYFFRSHVSLQSGKKSVFLEEKRTYFNKDHILFAERFKYITAFNHMFLNLLLY